MPHHVTVDPQVLGSQPTLTLEERAVIEGRAWSASYFESAGSGTAPTVLISTPATGVYHLGGEVGAGATVTYIFSKAPNASGGTAVTSLNRNGSSATADTLTLTSGVTYVSAGTTITQMISSSSLSRGIAVPGDPLARRILAPSTLYLLRVTSYATATSIFINLQYWRES